MLRLGELTGCQYVLVDCTGLLLVASRSDLPLFQVRNGAMLHVQEGTFSERGSMNTFVERSERSWRYLLALAVAVGLMAAMLMTAQNEAGAAAVVKNVTGVEVDSEMNRGNAAPAGTGDALVSILVTNSRTQRPLPNLAVSIARNNSGITLPARVSFDDLTVPATGCGITPTQLTNHGNGVYTIRFVPFVGNAACKWLSGDYLYLVTIKNGAGTVIGEGLAKLSL